MISFNKTKYFDMFSERLIEECKKRNIISCIDGAHAPGQIDLYLDDLGADFYVGNLHKWAYAPRGAAIVWTHPKFHKILEPLTTSHLFKAKMTRIIYIFKICSSLNTCSSLRPIFLDYYRICIF